MRATPKALHRVLPALLSWWTGSGLMLAGSIAPAISAGWNPTENVEIVVPSNPGSGPDLAARALRDAMKRRPHMEVPVTVVNKPGGSNAIAWHYLGQHPSPGHALLIVSLTLLTSHITGVSAIAPGHGTPLAQLFTEYVVFTVRADSPVASGMYLAHRLGENAEALSVAVGGGALGGTGHVATLIALGAAGVDVRRLRVVPFRSSSEAAAALLGGHVDVIASPASAVLQHAAAGKLRMIAISAPVRSGGQLASVPTWKEQGIDAEFGNARTVFGPRGLAQEQVAFWESVLAEATRTAEWEASLAAHHWTAAFLDSAGSKRALERHYKTLKSTLSGLGLARD